MRDIDFVRLTEIDGSELIEHMSDPRMKEHLPLLNQPWDKQTVDAFVSTKEDCWTKDGLGHWAFLSGGRYLGWGGFQKEDYGWDFALVLRPEAFGVGLRITRQALDFARRDARISAVYFLLAPTRKHVGALSRLGAVPAGTIEHAGEQFQKFRLDTD